MWHRRKHLVLGTGVRLSAMGHLTVVFALQRPAKVGKRTADRSSQGNRGRIAVMIRQQSSGTVDGT